MCNPTPPTNKSGRKPPPPKSFPFKVPENLLAKKDKEVQKSIKKYQLKSAVSKKKTGNKPLREKSLSCYETHYVAVDRFWCLLGKYDSCIILGDSAPKSCIPVEAEILVLYMRFKCLPRFPGLALALFKR